MSAEWHRHTSTSYTFCGSGRHPTTPPAWSGSAKGYQDTTVISDGVEFYRREDPYGVLCAECYETEPQVLPVTITIEYVPPAPGERVKVRDVARNVPGIDD